MREPHPAAWPTPFIAFFADHQFLTSLSLSLFISPPIMAEGKEGVGLQYWLQWQVAICSVIIAVLAVGAAAVIKRARPVLLMSSDLWVPCWRSLHPLWLLTFRAFAMVVMCWVLYESVLLFGLFIFYFYTTWTFVLVIIYFAIASIISAHGCWKHLKQLTDENEVAKGPHRRNLEDKSPGTVPFGPNKNRKAIKSINYNEQGELEQKAGFWGYLMQIVYQTCGGAVMLTDIVFWCLLLPFMSSDVISLTLVMVFIHSLNAVFLLLDTALNRLDFPWFRMSYFILWSCIYITFHWILHACGFTWWPYPFLELATPWAPLWYFGLALIHIPCYGLYYFIARAKNLCFSNCLPHVRVKAH